MDSSPLHTLFHQVPGGVVPPSVDATHVVPPSVYTTFVISPDVYTTHIIPPDVYAIHIVPPGVYTMWMFEHKKENLRSGYRYLRHSFKNE